MAQAAQHGKFQVGHAHALPPLTGLPERGKDQLQTTAFIPKPRDGLGTASLLGEGALNQIGGTNTLVMQGRAAQERQAGFQVVQQAGDRRRVDRLVGGEEG